MAEDFDMLVAAAMSAPFSGWDFSWLARRSRTQPPPWRYRSRVAECARAAGSMLDMGTGGGEVLSRLAARAPHTVATEAWPPNVGVAARRLRPLGVPVVQDEGAPDNLDQEPGRGRLPFRDEAFSLVCNRHEAFRASEVSRVLAPGGTFITQQVDCHSHDDLCRALGVEVPDQPDSWLPVAERQVGDAGLVVAETVAGQERIWFNDVAAVVYFLRVVDWAIPRYSLPAYRERLRALHHSPGVWPLEISQRQFFLIATKRRSAVRSPAPRGR